MRTMDRRVVETAGLMGVLIMVGTGCRTTIGYNLGDARITQPDPARQAMRVAVAPLRDARPGKERELPLNRLLYFGDETTHDKLFKRADVGRGVSEAFVRHFNHVRLFKVAELVDRPAVSPTADVLDDMEKLGYHALFTGTITHFYGIGYLTRFDRYVGVPLMYLSAGPSPFVYTAPIILPIMLLQKNKNEGYVEIVNLRLTDTATGSVLWSGSFLRETETKYRMPDSVRIVCETLGEIGDEIVKEIAAMELRQNSGVAGSVRTRDPEPDVVDGLRGVVVETKTGAGAPWAVQP